MRRKINPGIQAAITAWFAHEQRLNSVMRAYAEILLNEGAYEESIFLRLVQTLEHLHGVIFPERTRYFPRPSWKGIRRKLTQFMPTALTDVPMDAAEKNKRAAMFAERLQHLNDLSLQTKLENLLREMDPRLATWLLGNPNPRELEGATKAFANKVADTRHSLSHPVATEPVECLFRVRIARSDCDVLGRPYLLARTRTRNERS